MRVAELWRHPVKSFQGEQVEQSELDADGLRGDRGFGVVDVATGRVLTGRREPQLLLGSARFGDGQPTLRLPGGTELTGAGPATDAALSSWLGRPVTLTAATSRGTAEAEFFADPLDDGSEVVSWTMPPGRFVDALPLLIVTTAALRAGAAAHPDGVWHVRRFRPNIVVDVDGTGWVEDGWCGRTVRIGATVVAPVAPCQRCTMVTRPQPGLERDLDVFTALRREHGATFGVWTQIVQAGTIRTGDTVEVLE